MWESKDVSLLANPIYVGKKGLQLLSLMDTRDEHLAVLISPELLSDLFVGKGGLDRMRSTPFLLRILKAFKTLPITQEILVNNSLINPSHSYSLGGFRVSVIQRLLLERAGDVTFGIATFKALRREHIFHAYTARYKFELHIVWHILPRRPLRITKKVIVAARQRRCKAVLDIVLRPEFETIVREDSIKEAACQGDIVWFFRLLESTRAGSKNQASGS